MDVPALALFAVLCEDLPVAGGLVSILQQRHRLLSAARAILHLLAVEPKVRCGVFKLDAASTRYQLKP